jgi:hypothetical protein
MPNAKEQCTLHSSHWVKPRDFSLEEFTDCNRDALGINRTAGKRPRIRRLTRCCKISIVPTNVAEEIRASQLATA